MNFEDVMTIKFIAIDFFESINDRIRSLVLVLVVCAVAAVLYLLSPYDSGVYALCPFNAFTGLYCPGCGTLRGLHELLHGRVGSAMGLNPLMVLSLPFDPSEKVLAWANKIVAAHAKDRVIVATHAYRSRRGRTPIGGPIWEKLIRANANIFMVVCGHVCAVAHGVSVNDAGGKVHEILCDYQGLPNGGDGWLQTMRFSPATGKIHVEAYSPLLDKHNKAPQHTYTLEANLTTAK